MNGFGQYLIDEFVEEYLGRRMSRRDALRRLAAVTGSLAAATSILAACAPQPTPPAAETPTAVSPSPAATPGVTPAQPGAESLSVPANDPAVQAEPVRFPGQGMTLIGYLARPRSGEPAPGVLVCHENRGLTEHIQDVTRRLAKAGYTGLAVDLLSRDGGTDASAVGDRISGILGNATQQQFVDDFQAGMRYLDEQPYVLSGRTGMVGFCFGGGVTWLMAARTPVLRAAVPYYGPNPPLDEVHNIEAAVLGIYGELDERITQESAALEEALRRSGKAFEKIVYPNAAHGFNNDTGRSHNPQAARDAWSKTLGWFDRYLRA